ncbi:phosphoribosylanthranilate isomerase [Qipengyuania psychrotolerans]|uniref:N-(5'-phosphoribosyl)anthranilate isomerase n=1 Tax=Qipengyuania psychrotolerans TaxID=2867238 RepID=A0ABX8ZG93_9SPHN|nr:phosphoribosylanthranilate isomerase [Qipengyuania psychrotolerans]QZD88031.1 phosphoribosylanthranilate isomerase [Qipengyuania psychrotolerans]
MLIKICGISTPETMDAAVEAGATHVGLVNFEASPRHVTLEAAASLRARVPAGVKVVLLTVNMAPTDLSRAVDLVQPDVLQFHGRETPDWLAKLRETLECEIWKAVGLRDQGTLERCRQWIGKADRILFDAPAKALPGGNGEAFDWQLLANHDHKMDWGLAGGLGPDNVAEAIRLTAAPLVDTSSGVETAPGQKNPALIQSFCEAVRGA